MAKQCNYFENGFTTRLLLQSLHHSRKIHDPIADRSLSQSLVLSTNYLITV